MPFDYPNSVHVRKHGPAGYTDYKSFKPWLRDEFRFRCVYCLERERWYPSGHAAFSVDHVRPQGNPAFAALICDYENLVYACSRCNSVKQSQILLDPCAACLADHITVDADGAIAGLTPEGSTLVSVLGLDQPGSRSVRQRYLRVVRLFQARPDDPEVRALYLDCFGYPNDLPDLAALRPTENTRRAGLTETYFRQHAEGRLPETC